jgi:hypothetical protein
VRWWHDAVTLETGTTERLALLDALLDVLLTGNGRGILLRLNVGNAL